MKGKLNYTQRTEDGKLDLEIQGPYPNVKDSSAICRYFKSVLRRPGGHGEGLTPDPIPNSAVKPLSADGTAS